MRSWLRVIGLAAGVLLAGGVSGVQAQGVAGTWEWEMETMMRRGPAGAASEGQKSRVVLVLEVRGDSVVGSYTMHPPAGTEGAAAPQPREVRGTVSGNRVVFSMTSAGRINMGGETRETQLVSTFAATIEGDAIRGTMDVSSPDFPAPPPTREFSGRRIS